MIELGKIYKDMESDIDSVNKWSKVMYDEHFAPYFVDLKELFKRLQSKTHPITDDELEWILVDLSCNLFTVSEALAEFRTTFEVIKLKNKQSELEIIQSSIATTDTKKKEDAANQTLENKLLAVLVSTTIDRVEHEVSFARELIMGAKKIWDSRRNTDKVIPTKETLPDYKLPGTYIKGDKN